MPKFATVLLIGRLVGFLPAAFIVSWARRAETRRDPFGREQRMTWKQQRVTLIGGAMAVLAAAATLVLVGLRDSIVFFSTPSMVTEKRIPAGQHFRLGGIMESGSFQQKQGHWKGENAVSMPTSQRRPP